MSLAEVTQTVKVIDLSAYPQWLVVAVAAVIGAFLLWVLMKLLKWTLSIAVFLILVGGLAWAAWLLLKSLGWVR
jgi:hypothetical protein